MQVRIMKAHDPSGKSGPKATMPDVVVVHTPKDEDTSFDKSKDKEGYVKEAYAAPPAALAPQPQQPPVAQPGLA